MAEDKVSKAGIKPISSQTRAYGLLPGAVVLTLEGEKRVETLRPGMRIVSRDTGAVVLGGIARTKVKARLVRIKAGSLGHTRPGRDVTLPVDQPLLIRDWRAEAIFGAAQALAPVGRLVDGEFVTDLGWQRLTLYHLQFDAPHVVYVDGLELGTLPVPQSDTKAA